MAQAIFHLKRDHYRDRRTLGILMHPEGHEFCYVLEDTVRGFGIKDKKNTAIPATEGDFMYHMDIRESPKYGKVVVIYTQEHGGLYILGNGGIRFEMILCHGGNDEEDTEGCLLVNKNRDVEKMEAWGSMKDAILKEVQSLKENGLDVRLRVTNLRQKE